MKIITREYGMNGFSLIQWLFGATMAMQCGYLVQSSNCRSSSIERSHPPLCTIGKK
jgi:hypothetical protein